MVLKAAKMILLPQYKTFCQRTKIFVVTILIALVTIDVVGLKIEIVSSTIKVC